MTEPAAARAAWQEALACPLCGGGLRLGEDTPPVCLACHTPFRAPDGRLRLLRPQDVDRFARFAGDYRRARLAEGWPVLGAEQLLALPFVSPPGAPPLYWRLRSQTFRRLQRLLAREGPPPAAGPVADLGAGSGWLSYRLALAGYRVLALDASLDEAFGLGAAGPYLAAVEGRMLVAQGDLAHPPLRDGGWSVVLFNASLHYAADLDATLGRAARALAPGGRLIVVDTPIARRPVPGTGRGDRHLGRQELHGALEGCGLVVRWRPLLRGPRWWLHQVQAWLKGDALFFFPMVVAGHVPGGSRAHLPAAS